MKMPKLAHLLLFSFIFIFVFVSCTKEGPPGPAGGLGPQGPSGPNGATGTANVIYSSWFSFLATDWADSAMANFGLAKRANKLAPGITQTILDNGVVLAYVKHSVTAGLGPYQLPFIIPGVSTPPPATPGLIIGHLPVVGRLIFYNQRIDGSGGGSVNSFYQFRYIIIPGGVAGGRAASATAAGYSVDELKMMPYSRVASMFNIPENGSNTQ